MSEDLLFAVQIDCESTQRSIGNPALGERALRGLSDLLAETHTRGTFFVIPGDLVAHATIYRELESRGHEIGLHVHPSEQGYGEFLGEHGPDEQRAIFREASDRFAQVMGRAPRGVCPGYCSANDFTFGILAELGFTHGTVSFPTRNLPQCSCVWSGSPLDPHYAHRFNRLLAGDLDFVDLPITIDPDSRMWGGAHPQDLRVELVDAKNHWYTIDKAVKRQAAAGTPLRQVHAITHNVFEFGDRNNFRRQTWIGIVDATRQNAEQQKLRFAPATLADVAAAFRAAERFPQAATPRLKLDTRGREFNRP